MGIWAPNAEALRYKQNLGSDEMLLLFNISTIAYSQDRRPLTDRAEVLYFLHYLMQF